MAIASRRNARRLGTLVAAASIAALVMTGCSTSSPATSSGNPDDGTQLTMWVRSDGIQAKALVEAYNTSHKNQVKLTVVPVETFQQKVGAAAGSNSLPDLLTADVVYAPNYVKQGLFQDLTDKLKSLDYFDQIAPSHIEAATKDGKIYGAPIVVDSSVFVYNKALFKQAGLDPENPPTSFNELYAAAKAIRGLGGDTYGFYFAGNCAGCNEYTMFPYLAAAGNDPITDGGAKADFDNAAMQDTLSLYKKFVDEDIAPTSTKEEDGSLWDAGFRAGKIGILPTGSFLFNTLNTEKSVDWGVGFLPAPDGSANSTFVGGDVAAITKTSQHAAQAWDFISWTLSEDAQVQVDAKNGFLPVRSDLADNEFTAADPRISEVVKNLVNGYTPASVATGQIFNDNNGVWLSALRNGIYGGQGAAAVTSTLQSDVQSALDEANQ